MSPMLHLSQDPEADRLISENPLALLIGMVLDQQVPLEWAFAGPAELKRRLGDRLDARMIASMDTGQLVVVHDRSRERRGVAAQVEGDDQERSEERRVGKEC